ncbi:hypothetical protein ABTE84_19405, partial [Acinetobacter baumannii]
MAVVHAAMMMVLGLLAVGLTVWGGFALWFQLPCAAWLRIAAIVLWSLPPAATLALVAAVPGLPGLPHSWRWG